MSVHAVAPLRPRPEPGYDEAAALNDIHAICTAASSSRDVLAEIGEVLARTGRPMIPARDITICATETAQGWPVACAQSGGISVFVRQEPAGPGLVVDITTKTLDDAGDLTVTLDDLVLFCAGRVTCQCPPA
jgi:hypothetical protein